ncbi:hypothetical protein UFOVP181_361 [uncultured Caudovirales phage]|uniref:Uncharacterized protein n=1 Tax=uncultured Caudovirales phage TaxID=2100421 RepID=A0A6J7WLF0_9CAUD|nr:hypothetical protein UFOVP57_278 [uncultured Caudovirales phage]CAB5209216.1 hypothetical protein UFOVP181_361 [uncultured Caudovirales phage]
MATGRLGTITPSATTLTTVYTVPSGNYSVFNVSFTNTNTTAVTIRLAMATTATPAANEYIEYDTTIIAKGVFERTGLVANGGLQIVAYCSAANVNVNVYGIETSTT